MRLQARLVPQSEGRFTRSCAMVVSLLIACGLVVSCSSEGPAEGEVVLYTSMPDDVVDRLEGVIERRFPDLDGNLWITMGSGISLTVVRGRTADIQELIASEVNNGGIRADLIWLAEPSPYETYKNMGLLAPYEPPLEAPILPSHIDADGFYVAGRIISMVIAWNTSLWPEGLADWPDLQNVELNAFPAPESGAARATIKALTDKYGREFFTTLASVGGVSVRSNGAARDGVAEGTFEAVAVLDYMARDAKAAGSAIDFVYPAGGTVSIPSPIAITTDAPNPAAARAVIDFILSQPGQKILVEIGNFYPVRSDVAPPVGAPPLDAITALDVDWKELAGEIDAISTLWESLYGTSVGSG
ncbi:MAG: extracellular solute-binding protein [Acidimicrobiia bacterium]|nr:extracellular solute-binding protein [Acidimicrobiia bacterium]